MTEVTQSPVAVIPGAALAPDVGVTLALRARYRRGLTIGLLVGLAVGVFLGLLL